jgi:hypothetical protein
MSNNLDTQRGNLVWSDDWTVVFEPDENGNWLMVKNDDGKWVLGVDPYKFDDTK